MQLQSSSLLFIHWPDSELNLRKSLLLPNTHYRVTKCMNDRMHRRRARFHMTKKCPNRKNKTLWFHNSVFKELLGFWGFNHGKSAAMYTKVQEIEVAGNSQSVGKEEPCISSGFIGLVSQSRWVFHLLDWLVPESCPGSSALRWGQELSWEFPQQVSDGCKANHNPQGGGRILAVSVDSISSSQEVS